MGAEPYVLARDAGDFSSLTFPKLSKSLRDIAAGGDTAWFAIGVRCAEQRPIALAVGAQFGQDALLHSIYVLPSLRGQGLGARALALWEQEASRRGARRVLARFSEAAPGRGSLERLLNAAHWTEPTANFFQLVGHPGKMARRAGAWTGVRKRILVSQDIEYAPFVFSEADEPAIARLLAQPEASHFPHPRKYADSRLPELSLALRRRSGGELVGWLIAVPGQAHVAASVGCPDSTVVRYAEFYLDAALWTTGASLGVFHHVFLRQAELYGEDSLIVYFTHPGVPKMVNFSRRRFAPIALRFDTVFECRKEMSPA
jgi:GNAT superfamily N-acetyltransferase